MSWLELSVIVDQEAAEPVAELLARYGYNSGVVVDQPFVPGDEGPEFEYDSARPVTLRTYLPVDASTEETRARIEQALWHLGQMRPVGRLEVRALEEQDWANAWKRHYGVQRIGERTVIVPSWLEYAPQPGEIVLHLDPGMAFGTGLHPTTQLCLRLLELHARPGLRTLDLGAGSGILAIAAAKLGAAPVLALDNDPIAVEAAQENVARNGQAAAITVELGSLGAGSKMGHWLSGDFGASDEEPEQRSTQHTTRGTQFDLIVANLIAKVLIIIAADLKAALASGGTLITCGIIAEREDEVALAFAAAGLHPLARYVEGEWVALVHGRVGEGPLP
jgi:ribosomal protein L11 methyltransferase